MTKDMEYFVNLNLKGNEIKEAIVEQVDTLPTTNAVKGRFVYLRAAADSYAAGFYYHDGSGWKLIVDTKITDTLAGRVKDLEDTIGSSGSIGTDVANLKTTVYGAGDGDTGLVGSVNKNAGDITNINTTIGADDTSGLRKRITDNETAISGIRTDIGTDTTSGSVKYRIKTLEDEMDAAQTDITTLKGAVGDSSEGLLADVATLQTQVGTKATEGVAATGLYKDVDDINAALDTKQPKEEGKGLSEANFTNVEKTKLSGIAEGAQVNKIEIIKVNDVAQAISDKTVNINLEAYALKSDITSVFDWKGTVASTNELPASGNKVGDVYHVTAKSAEHVWNGSAWEELGSIVDLSGYYTSTQTDSAISTAVSTAKTELTEEIKKKANDAELAPVAKSGAYSDLTGTPTVDAALSGDSTNAIQNKAVYTALAGKVDKLSSKPTAGTYSGITINAEGQVTAATKLAVSDLPGEIPTSKIKDFTADVRTAVRFEGTLTFGASETEKTIEHGLGINRPHVTIYSGTQIVYAGVETVDANTIKVSGNNMGTVVVVVSV